MANGIMGYDNRVDEAAVTGAAAVGAMTPERVQTRDLWDVFRVAGPSLWIEAAFAAPVPARLLGAYGLNATVRGLFRVRGYEDLAKAVPAFDTGAWDGADGDGWHDICPAVIPLSQRRWERDTFWSGKPTDREWSRWPKRKTIDLGVDVRVRVIRWDILDVANPDGVLEVGRLFVGSALQPAWNFSRGAAAGATPFTTTRRSASGHRTVEESRPGRTFRMTWGFLTDDERRAFYDLVAVTGETGEVAWLPYPGRPDDELRWGGLYTLRSLPPVVTANAGQHSADVELEEWK